MSETWSERAYPFAKARKVAQEFAEKEVSEEHIENWADNRTDPDRGPSYLTLLCKHAPNYLDSTSEGLAPDFLAELNNNAEKWWEEFLYKKGLPAALRYLGKAVQKLIDAELQPDDKEDILMITKLGPDLVEQFHQYFAVDWPRESPSDDPEEDFNQAEDARHVMVEFATIPHQLELDIAALRQR